MSWNTAAREGLVKRRPARGLRRWQRRQKAAKRRSALLSRSRAPAPEPVPVVGPRPEPPAAPQVEESTWTCRFRPIYSSDSVRYAGCYANNESWRNHCATCGLERP